MRRSPLSLLAPLALAAASRAALAQPPAPDRDDARAVWNTADAVLPPNAAPTATSVRVVRGIATRPDLVLRDGTIEFDLALPEARGVQFAGIAFRIASSADYELMELVSNADGTRWSGVQYQPVFEGESTWQLYSTPAYTADVPRHGDARVPRPLHVRLVVSGTRADVYLDGAGEPVLRVPELKRAPAVGAVGVWAGSPDGLVSLTRWVGNPAGAQRTGVAGGAGWGLALARLELVADHAQTARLHFGYSDGVAIYLDGESVYVGRNDADSRYRGYLDALSRDADAVDLRLRKGRNVLTLVVTDRAFGLGFAARLEQTGGVRVEAP